ncbi:DUF2141 domain-containing protein [Halomonas sp. LR3S48]|uniref:DUF2141 domain-containing protein n=1 Tax=Halomonas sp. LR3S48 TaxID=2982694 RepID=UPI0021E460B3|nr:DUF2141 domain-containing protein [Halomonas sp. LR3S48]UYG04944.1 DUF2141 domain-containing protein [Halomonas sp. LR3S48]
MSDSTNQKSLLGFSVCYPVTHFNMGLRYVALWAVMMLANFPVIVFAQGECPGIHVNIPNISNSNGAIACALFESSEGFPTEFLHSATNIMLMKIQDTQARCYFLDIQPGTYALAIIHDENMDGKLDTNFLGVPTEGYGFSSGAKASMSAPSFEDASFSYDGGNLGMSIQLSY